MSNEHFLVGLGYLEDYTTRLCEDYNKAIVRIRMEQPV